VVLGTALAILELPGPVNAVLLKGARPVRVSAGEMVDSDGEKVLMRWAG
jgi:hypothetical protein